MATPISERMEELGFTDVSLAQRVECDRSMVNKIKFGKAEPSLPLALKLSAALGMPPSAFARPVEPKSDDEPLRASA